jgi:hypothetical protein
MEFDEIYKYVGHMGRFQWLIFAVVFLLNMFCMDIINMIFVGGHMDHWCSIDELSGLTPEQQRHVAVPMTSSPDDDVIVYSSCEMFDVNWSAYSVDELMNWNRTAWMKEMDHSNSTISVKGCSKWNYDRSMFKSTIVSRVRIQNKLNLNLSFSRNVILLFVDCILFRLAHLSQVVCLVVSVMIDCV